MIDPFANAPNLKAIIDQPVPVTLTWMDAMLIVTGLLTVLSHYGIEPGDKLGELVLPDRELTFHEQNFVTTYHALVSQLEMLGIAQSFATKT